jgi:hypothetical protein
VADTTPIPPASSTSPRAWHSRRVLWHALGLLVAALVAWLIVLGYRQPGLVLDLANMLLC